MSARDDLHGCPSPEDLTAFAHGEGHGPVREAVSRHLLACGECREAYGGTRSLLRRLRTLEPMLATPAAAHAAGRERSSWLAVGGGALVAAVFLLAFLLPVGNRGERGGADRTSEAAASEIAALVEAQRPDGSWPADSSFGGSRHDTAATALALLALVPRDGRGLREGPRGRAIAEAVRWLVAREASRPASADPASLGDDAVSASALLALYSATGESGLRRPIDRVLRRVAHAPLSESSDRATLRWVAHALANARAAGWRNVEDAEAAARARLSALGAGADEPWDLPAHGWGTASSACLVALRVLARARARAST